MQVEEEKGHCQQVVEAVLSLSVMYAGQWKLETEKSGSRLSQSPVIRLGKARTDIRISLEVALEVCMFTSSSKCLAALPAT
eukprot:scaffold150083_cov34-Attheya_sp.AAC.2